VKPADLRALVAPMTDAPWSTTKPTATEYLNWPDRVVVAATAPGQAVYAHAARGAFPESDRSGIAALRATRAVKP
jgi:hypothetical protein